MRKSCGRALADPVFPLIRWSKPLKFSSFFGFSFLVFSFSIFNVSFYQELKCHWQKGRTWTIIVISRSHTDAVRHQWDHWFLHCYTHPSLQPFGMAYHRMTVNAGEIRSTIEMCSTVGLRPRLHTHGIMWCHSCGFFFSSVFVSIHFDTFDDEQRGGCWKTNVSDQIIGEIAVARMVWAVGSWKFQWGAFSRKI